MAILKFISVLSKSIVEILRTIKGANNESDKKILTLAVVTGIPALVSTGAGAWWSDNDDYWDGPWGYPGYGWGGYPGYGGWGQHTPRIEIYTESQESSVPRGYSVE
jgi:hypothetical protein